MERVPRVKWQKKGLLSGSLASLLFGIFVGSRVFRYNHLRGDSSDIPKNAFFTLYFGVIGWAVLRGLVAFQSMEIDREEIRVYLGPLRIRTIPVNAIRSVFRTTKFEGKNGDNPMYVIQLLFETPTQRRERGERPMLGASFWVEDSEELRAILTQMLPRSVVNL